MATASLTLSDVSFPMDADVYLAVAAHGAFDPELMPEILQKATNPGPDIW